MRTHILVKFQKVKKEVKLRESRASKEPRLGTSA